MSKGKATKKFEKRHLKDVLKHRGSISKIKKSQQKKEKKKARARREASPQGDDGDHSAGAGDGDAVDDEFFQTGFALPERVKTKRKAPSSSSTSKSKKAKLNHDDSDSDNSKCSALEEQRTGGVVDAAVESEEDDGGDEAKHKTQLEALKKKDPEFYKYLEENDEELLQFEDDDLAGIDLLSDDDASASKLAKSGKEEGKERSVDAGLVERWRTALVEAHSLRSTRELVLAFRAAVHAGEESERKFRYSIPSPEGTSSD
jgi:nucleolar complex protein 2